MYDRNQIGPCEALGTPVMNIEDSLQSMVGEIMEMSKVCRGISGSIQNNLFGPQLQDSNKKETNVNCMAEALKEIRAVLNETINTLDNVSRKL